MNVSTRTVSVCCLVAVLTLAACQDREEEARQILSGALDAHAAATDAEASPDDRLAALDRVEAALAQIRTEYNTTDIGLELASEGRFGILEPAALPDIRAEIEVIQAAEACVTHPTADCLLSTMTVAGFEPPQPGGTPLEVLEGVLRSASADPADYIDNQNFRGIAPYVALTGLLTGQEERAIAYLQAWYDDVPTDEVIAFAMLENMEALAPSRDARAVVNVISSHVGTIAEPDSAAVAFAAELFSDNPTMERLQHLDTQLQSEGSRMRLPNWLFSDTFLDLASEEERGEMLSQGLDDWSHEILSREQMIEAATLSLERDGGPVRERQLWYAARHGFLDEVIATAEEVGPLPRAPGYYAATRGAMQLGFEGNQEGLDRILAVAPGQPDFVLANFAFGQVLAGADPEVLSDLGQSPAVVSLALALQGRTPEEVFEFFGFEIDPRLDGVEERDVRAASVFNLDLQSEIPARRELEGFEPVFREAFKRDLASGNIDLDRAEEILVGLRDDQLAMFLATSVEDPSHAMALIDRIGPTAQAYRTMLIHRGVLANSAEEYLAAN